MSEHSPTPWQVHQSGCIIGAEGHVIEKSAANDIHIVRCVNSREALVAALQNLVDFCEDHELNGNAVDDARTVLAPALAEEDKG